MTTGNRYASHFAIAEAGAYGIEDYKQKKDDHGNKIDHFFPEHQKKRFKVWHNGCGIGDCDTLEKCHVLIYTNAVTRIASAKHMAEQTVTACDLAMIELHNRYPQFRQEPDEGPRRLHPAKKKTKKAAAPRPRRNSRATS